jgi:hypothetical protein
MNPSYFRIKLPLEEAKKRLSQWCRVPEPGTLIKTNSSEAIDLACTEEGEWRGDALFLYKNEGWSVFEDLSGGFGSIKAKRWLEFAQTDAFVFGGYNDSIPYGELIVIEHGKIMREFMHCPDEPEDNVDSGKLPWEKDGPIESWIEVASFVDDDDLVFSESGWLWVIEGTSETG